MSTPRTSIIGATLATGCAIALAGCGGGAGTASPAGPSSSKPSGTPSQSSSTSGGAPSQASQAPSAAAHGGSDAVQAAYSATNKANSAKITQRSTTTVGQKTVHVRGHGVVQFKPAEFDMRTTTHGTTIETRLIGDTAYIKSPQGKWLSFDVSKLTGRPGAAKSPTQSLQYLRAGSQKVTNLGPATIHGVHTTGYKAIVDLDKTAARAKTPQAKKAVKMIESMTGKTTMPIKVWIDRKNRLVRDTTHLDMHVQGQHVTTTTTMDLTDFGTAVHVTAPPKSKVTTAPAPPMQ